MQDQGKFSIGMSVQFNSDELFYYLKLAAVGKRSKIIMNQIDLWSLGTIGAMTLHTAYKFYLNLRHEKGRSRWKEFLAAIGFIPVSTYWLTTPIVLLSAIDSDGAFLWSPLPFSRFEASSQSQRHSISIPSAGVWSGIL